MARAGRASVVGDVVVVVALDVSAVLVLGQLRLVGGQRGLGRTRPLLLSEVVSQCGQGLTRRHPCARPTVAATVATCPAT